MRKHIFAALLALGGLGVIAAAAPAVSAATTQQGLFDLGNQPYNWARTAPHYKAIILNDWKAAWAHRIAGVGAKPFVYKDLTSTRETDCGTSPGGGQPCIQWRDLPEGRA